MKKTRIGKVHSNKMDKSITVVIERKLKDPIYGKTIRRNNKLMAHDAENQCQPGDLVKIQETRPLSKKKKWELVEIIEKAK